MIILRPCFLPTPIRILDHALIAVRATNLSDSSDEHVQLHTVVVPTFADFLCFSTSGCQAAEHHNTYAALQGSDHSYFVELLGSKSCISDDETLSKHNS